MRSCALKDLVRFFVSLGRGVLLLCLFSIPAARAGTENTPVWNETGQYYTIADAEQFRVFRDWVNAGRNEDLAYKLTADIHLDNEDWTPIGNAPSVGATPGKYFRGALSGDGHTVSGFKVIGGHRYAGLFGYSKGSISDLGVTDFVVSVNGGNNTVRAGGLVGHNDGGGIVGSFAMGSVITASSGNISAGGLVG